MVSESISLLIDFAENPQNCFDEYLSQNKNEIKNLSSRQLEFLLIARENCQKAYSFIPFTRKELELSVKERLVKPDGIFAQVCNDFLVADSFFEK